MSELRVDNIVSQDGSAAPIYSKGLNIGAGQTLTNAGDYTVSGQSLFTGITTFQGGAVYGGGVTVSDNVVVNGSLQVTQASNFNTTGIITCGTLDVSGSTSFGDITGTISNLVVGAGASIVGVTTAASFEQTDGSKVATTGKAIAMAMVFG